MGADLRNMGRIAAFLNHVLPFDAVPTVKEMQAAVPKEFDFSREARIMSAMGHRLARLTPKVLVPQPCMPLCGPGIIVMQRMEGTPMTQLLAAAMQGDEAARDLARKGVLAVLEVFGHTLLVDGMAHCDPHPGNILMQPDGRVALLDFGQVSALGAKERRGLCALFSAIARGSAKDALAAGAPFGLVLAPSPSSPTPATKQKNTPSAPSLSAASAAELVLNAHAKRQQQQGGSPTAIGSTVLTALQRLSAAGGQPGEAARVGLATRLLQQGVGGLGLGREAAAVLLSMVPDEEVSGMSSRAVLTMLTIMFDTMYVPEGESYSFGGKDVVPGIELESFPACLYLVMRSVMILRGLCASLGMHDISAVRIWQQAAALGLNEKPALAEARAAENAALDRGLKVHGV
ncbi:hypothetical protein V8C86DRAFT_2827502 [Haematococcus lacustris]